MQDELEKIRKTRCLPPSKSPLFILVHGTKISKDWLINSMVGELTFVVFLTSTRGTTCVTKINQF